MNIGSSFKLRGIRSFNMYLLEAETLEVAVFTLFILLLCTVLYSLRNPSEAFLTKIVPVLAFFHLLVLVILLVNFFGVIKTATADTEKWGELYSFALFLILILSFGIMFILLENYDGRIGKKIRYLQTLHPTSTIVTTIQLVIASYVCPEYPDAINYLFGHVVFGIHVTVYRLLVPKLFATDDYFCILTKKSEIAEYMKSYEGVSEDGVYYGGQNVKRKQIALFTWHYQNVRLVGHVSLGLTSIDENKSRQEYISIWPSSDSQQIGETWRSAEVSTLESDVVQESGYPDHILLFKHSSLLNEADILREMKNSDWPPDYNVFHQNCMSAIKVVLIAGGLKRRIFCGENFMIRLPATNTKEFAEEIPYAFILPLSSRLVQLTLYILFMSMDICIKFQVAYMYGLAAYVVYYMSFASEDESFNFFNRTIEYLYWAWNTVTETYPGSYYYLAYFVFCFVAGYFQVMEKLYKKMKDLIQSN